MSLQPTKGLIPAVVNPDAIVEFTPEVEAGAVAQGLIDESPKATTKLWLGGRPRHLIFCIHPHNAMMLHLKMNGGWRKLEGAVFLAEYEQDAETGEWWRKDGGSIHTGPVAAPAREVAVTPAAPSGEAQRGASGERRAVSIVTERSITSPAVPIKTTATEDASLPPGLAAQAPRAAAPSGELDEMFGGPKPGIGDLSGLPTARSSVGMSYPAGSVIPANISKVDLSAALASRPAGPLRDEIGKGLWDAVLPRALELEEREKARDTTLTALKARITKIGKAP